MAKKKKPVDRKNKETKEIPTPSVSEESSQKYGGLPERDLKKNLGCG